MQNDEYIEVSDEESQLPVPLWMFRLTWYQNITHLLKGSREIITTMLRPFFPLVSVAAGAAIDINDLVARRHSERKTQLILQTLFENLIEFKELYAEHIADLYCEMHELSERCVKEPYEKKLRYFTELVRGLMSPEIMLRRDKYYRFKRWVEQLDLLTLKCLSRFETIEANVYSPEQSQLSTFEQLSHGVGSAIPIKLEYAYQIIKDEPTSLWEFISQCQAIGLLFFDRGGGAAGPAGFALCIWHRDCSEFACYLRNADTNKLWPLNDEI